MKKILSSTLMTLAIVLSVPTQSLASDVITIIAPVAAGGPTDIMARKLATEMTARGTPTIVVNRPGGDRIIGANLVAEAASNGKTLMIGSGSDVGLLPLIPNPAMKFNENTFVPIAYLAAMDGLLTARPDFPANNFKEFLALVRKNPNKYSIGSFGKTTELQARTMFKMAGGTPNVINYKSDPQVAVDIINGSLDLGIQSVPTVVELVKAKKLKVIASLGEQREKAFPQVGTAAEVNGWHWKFWFGIFAPPGTSPELVKQLNQTINQAMSNKELADQLNVLGYTTQAMSPAQFDAFYRFHLHKYRKLVAEWPSQK